eukprot:5699502-Pleurochrysis_carterae.AAC.3
MSSCKRHGNVCVAAHCEVEGHGDEEADAVRRLQHDQYGGAQRARAAVVLHAAVAIVVGARLHLKALDTMQMKQTGVS